MAPLWAALTARLNELTAASGKKAGFFLPTLYKFPEVLRDITAGNNRPSSQPSLGYDAGPGWDPCTGLGVPDGGLLAVLLTRTARSRCGLAAVSWADSQRHVRCYAQDTQDQVEEFCQDGSWSLGATLPIAGPASKLAAAEWTDQAATHLRLYYQDAQGALRERCYDGSLWQVGSLFVTSMTPGSSIAAAKWADGGGAHVRVYYQDTSTLIREYCFDDGQWTAGGTLATAAAGTSLAAALWTDGNGVHIRVYYQDTSTLIREHCFDGQWAPGTSWPTAVAGTGLATALWTDAAGAHIRVYYETVNQVIREHQYEGAQWADGQFVLPTA